VRRRAWLTVVGLVLVACGGGNNARPATTTIAPPERTDAAASATEPILASSPVGLATDEPALATNLDAQAPTDAAARRPIDGRVRVGQLAPVLLRPARSSQIVVEVRAQTGAEPSQASIDHVLSALRGVTAKRVDVVEGAPVGGGSQAWTTDGLAAIADAGTSSTADTVVIHVLFVHGSLGGDTSVLGVASRGDLVTIFSDQIRASASLLSSPQPIEVATVTHEMGHLLGLVDLFLATGRQDPEHPGHSRNPRSVMYWAVESSLVGSLLGERPPADFDAQDLADLATIRNGG
jgi:hypothetical protein